MVRWISCFVVVVLAAGTPVDAQVTRRDSRARSADQRADSLRSLREQRADSIRRRTVEDRAPTRAVRSGGRGQPAAPRGTGADTVRSLDLPPLRLTTRPIATDTVAAIPRPSRPRAAIMRVRGQANAPAFCESGAGHPLYGREWCFERGFRLGDTWERARGRDIAIDRSAASRAPLDAAAVRRLFGDDLAERVEAARTALQLPDSISARWISTPVGGSILVLAAGQTAIAELIDRDRDGRAEVIWVARAR